MYITCTLWIIHFLQGHFHKPCSEVGMWNYQDEATFTWEATIYDFLIAYMFGYLPWLCTVEKAARVYSASKSSEAWYFYMFFLIVVQFVQNTSGNWDQYTMHNMFLEFINVSF